MEINFLCGTDPEIAIKNRNSIVKSKEYLYYSRGLYPDEHEGDEWGADGAGKAFEVRPLPSKCPIKLVNNIHEILKQTVKKDKKLLSYNWKSGSFVHPGVKLGGHVHFGVRGHHYYDSFEILDQYLGLPCLLLENKDEAIKRRRGGHYGFKSDIRENDHGFEYRTLGSWMSSPYIAAAVLCLSKTVMHEFLNNKNFDYKVFSDEPFHSIRNEDIYFKFPQIWKDITQMKLYQKYKPYIDLIYFLVQNRLTWFPKYNMKESWGLYDDTIIFTEKMKLETIWLKNR